jgi:hypothetical protein
MNRDQLTYHGLALLTCVSLCLQGALLSVQCCEGCIQVMNWEGDWPCDGHVLNKTSVTKLSALNKIEHKTVLSRLFFASAWSYNFTPSIRLRVTMRNLTQGHFHL